MKTIDINKHIGPDLDKDIFFKLKEIPQDRFLFTPKISKWNQEIKSKEDLISLLISDDKHVNVNENDNDNRDNFFDLYIHIPFCKTFCSFCACNITTKKSSKIEDIFLDALNAEIDFYAPILKHKKLKNLYLGGGTPTYLNLKTLEDLLKKINTSFQRDDNFTGFIESTPQSLSTEIIKLCKSFDINHFKVGIQDLSQIVLTSVNRIHELEYIPRLLELKNKYDLFLHIELIAGLAHQNSLEFIQSIKEIIQWNIESITVYPLIVQNHLKKIQRDLGFVKLAKRDKINILFEANQFLLNNNFTALGFDCFRNNNSKLKYPARSIMGFSPTKSSLLVGIGPSAISKSHSFIRQNEKILDKYLYLSSKDLLIKKSNSHITTQLDKYKMQIIEDCQHQNIDFLLKKYNFNIDDISTFESDNFYAIMKQDNFNNFDIHKKLFISNFIQANLSFLLSL